MLATLVQDLRHAFRALLKQPGYLATAVLTLAVGIGFATAMFSVVHAVLLRPLPFKDPDRLVQLRERNLPRFPQFSVSPGHYFFWRDHNTTFEGIAGVQSQFGNVDYGQDQPQRVRADRVSGNFFDVLGVSPAVGRALTLEDETPGRAQVAVLSYRVWEQRFGRARDIVNRTIRLDGRPFTIIGVMPEALRYPTPEVELWIPLEASAAARREYGSHNMTAIGRLKQGATLEQADADMQSVSSRLTEQNPGSRGWEVLLFDLQEYSARNVRQSLLVLLGAVALVLLIACANVANLLLARGAVRQKELAIRSSIGATRGRLLRQLLVEHAALSLVSTAAGVLVAAWLLRVLLTMVPDALPPHVDVALDRTVLVFAVALAAATPLLFGLFPAVQASRPDLRSLMSAGGRSGGGLPAARTRTVLVVAEIALAMTLLVGAGLLIRSFAKLAHESPGFDPGGALLAGVSLPVEKYPEGDPRERFVAEFLARVRSLPQVEAAGLSVPMAMVNDFNSSYEVEGQPAPPEGQPLTLFYAVSADFFQAMRIPLVRGRFISADDRRDGHRVIVINEFLADRHFPGTDPIGRRMRVGQGRNAQEWREIVGVVGNVKQTGLTEAPRAQVYEPHLQHPYFSAYSLIVRSGAPEPMSVVPGIRAVLKDLDAELPLARVRPLDEVVDATVRPQRFSTALIVAFGAAALLLAAVGLYGVIAYSVGLRRREFAIRVAHGAGRRDVLRLVLHNAVWMAVAGLGIGLLAAWLLRSVLQGLLFNVSTTDPATYAGVAAVLAGTTLLASAIPALRATRVDPVEALRE